MTKGCCGIRAKNETRAGANTCKKLNKSCCGIRGTRAAVEYESKSEQGLQRNTTKIRTMAAAGVRAKNGTRAAPEHVQKTEQGLLRNTCKKRNKGCSEYVQKNGTRASVEYVPANGTKDAIYSKGGKVTSQYSR